MNDSGTAGPAWSAAASPVRTKMPAPIMAPMPSIVRFKAVRARLSDRSLVASASARSDATDLVAQRFMRNPFWGISRAVVRSFPRDRHVVWVRLSEAGRGDLNHFDIALQLGNGADPAVTHAAAKAPNHLIEHIGHRPLVGNPAFDALGYHLGSGHFAFLEVAVGRAVLHGGEAAHAADHLETAAFGQHRFAWAFLGSGQHRAHHH